MMNINFNYSFVIISYALLSAALNNCFAKDNNALLTLTPEICVVEHKKQRCKTVLVINYNSDKVHDYCVVIPAQGLKRCLNQVRNFTIELAVDTQNDLVVYIEDRHNATLYADAIFRVSQFKPKTRRKRSFGWNFL